MKACAFDYERARDVTDAVRLLSAEGAKPAAGMQSLGPMLNLRLVQPRLLVDIRRLEELKIIREERDTLALGACVTHAEIEDGRVPGPTGAFLRKVASRIAYRAVRNRGTIGGSLAHADPAADWVNVLTALGADVVLATASARRLVPLPAFFTGPFATALQPGEIIAGVRVPKRTPRARWGYWKFCLKAGDFAKASAAVLIDPERGDSRVLIGAIERPPASLREPEDFIAGRIDAAAAVAQAAPHLDAAARTLHVTALTRALALANGSGA